MTSSSLRIYFVIVMALWVSMTALSYFWNTSQQTNYINQLAQASGRTLFSLMETTRHWNAMRGGVYVKVDEKTQPNPYLAVPNRDLQIGDLKLTMVNPAFMTRQIGEIAAQRAGVHFHITSLKPIRPENEADDWEKETLVQFESGLPEKLSLVDDKVTGPIFRYMAPLKTREACLKCHAKQGYKVGDIRGGISVNIPAFPLLNVLHDQKQQLLLIHIGALLLLVSSTIIFFRSITGHMRALEETKASQEVLIDHRTKELSKQTHELKRSNQELELFAYAASHDLQEPLRMVSSYMNLLDKRYSDKLDDDAKEFIGYATDGAKRMRRMINDLLDYSRVESRGGELRSVNANEALEKALANLELVIEETSTLVQHEELPSIEADELQLVRLFQNLISNAIRYRKDKGTPHIKVNSFKDDDGKLVISVEDNGIGIPADKFDDVFMIFNRLKTGRVSEGTGIGLALCKRIMERHGGRIWLESEEGKGTTFFVSF